MPARLTAIAADIIATPMRVIAVKPSALERGARCQVSWRRIRVATDAFVASAKEGSQSQKADSSHAERTVSFQSADLSRVRVGKADRAALGLRLLLFRTVRRETLQCEGGAAVGGREGVAVDDQTDALESGCGAVQGFGFGGEFGVQVHRVLLEVLATSADSLTPRYDRAAPTAAKQGTGCMPIHRHASKRGDQARESRTRCTMCHSAPQRGISSFRV